MTEQRIPNTVKRYLWVVLPLLGGFAVGATVLSKSSESASHSSTETVAASPSPSSNPTIVSTTAPSPLNSTAPTKTVKPRAIPVNPAHYTEQQKAMNQEAKSRFLVNAGTVDSLIEMKVAIAEGLPSLTIGASSKAVLMNQNGKQLRQLAANKLYTVQPNGSGISFGDWQLPEMVMVDPGIGQVFQLGDRIYRGRLLIVVDKGVLWAVNYINLRQYLHSVVPSEVSASWPMEALKAQAVAARSYALTYYFKPINSLFHLGATEYYQVYSGVDRESDATRKAVDITAGEFVSYRGGIVESLYAASDDIVAEAFQGHGMSQLGALNLAEKGLGYKQILGNYYPGTGVSRVEEDYN